MTDGITTPEQVRARRGFIAAPWHTLSILLIFAFFSYRDAQHVSAADTVHEAVSRGVMLRGYLLSIVRMGNGLLGLGGSPLEGRAT
jgi:hypothetical protein